MTKRGLYANINARKKKGISRSKKNSTITPKAYANMQAGFPNSKKNKNKKKDDGSGEKMSDKEKMKEALSKARDAKSKKGKKEEKDKK